MVLNSVFLLLALGVLSENTLPTQLKYAEMLPIFKVPNHPVIRNLSCDMQTLTPGQTCNLPWSQIRTAVHPTQQAVGVAWVQHKVESDFETATKAQKTMNISWVPYVLGPKKVAYVIDDHHTISALEASGYHSTIVTVYMVCDWSSLTNLNTFWNRMLRSNFLYGLGRSKNSPNMLPLPINASTIPALLGDLMDDPWRSLAGYSRKVEDKSCPSKLENCLRAYDRVCDASNHSIPFFEFRWGYYMNLGFLNHALWDEESQVQAFNKLYLDLPFPSVLGKVKTDNWQKAADHVAKLCRGKDAATYIFPSSLGAPFASTKLPGYVPGTTKIDHDDPTCLMPTCPA